MTSRRGEKREDAVMQLVFRWRWWWWRGTFDNNPKNSTSTAQMLTSTPHNTWTISERFCELMATPTFHGDTIVLWSVITVAADTEVVYSYVWKDHMLTERVFEALRSTCWRDDGPRSVGLTGAERSSTGSGAVDSTTVPVTIVHNSLHIFVHHTSQMTVYYSLLILVHFKCLWVRYYSSLRLTAYIWCELHYNLQDVCAVLFTDLCAL